MMTKEVPQDFQLQGSVELEAAASSAEGEDRFFLLANSGVPIELGNFEDPVIVDFNGVSFDKDVTAVIKDHDTSQRVGHTLAQAIVKAGATTTVGGRVVDGPMIAALATRSSDTVQAKEILADIRKGFPFQVSIGARIQPGGALFIEAGETYKVNGKTWEGPLIVASKTKIREISVTVLGADSNTSATIAATQRRTNMTFEDYVKSLGLNAADLSDAAKSALKAQYDAIHGTKPVQASSTATAVAPPPLPSSGGDRGGVDPALTNDRKIRADESRRVSSIEAISRKFKADGFKVKVDVSGTETEMDMATLTAHAIENGWDANQFELECRRADYPEPQRAPAIHSQTQDYQSQAVEAAVLRYFGTVNSATNPVSGQQYGLEHMFEAQVLEESHRPQYRFAGSIQALMDMQIRAAGMYYPGLTRTGSDFVEMCVEAHESIRRHRRQSGSIQASGFSTLSLTNILENVMHKSALASFDAVESVWRYICGRRPANDFRAQNLYILDFNGKYRQIPVDGEIKHISLVDAKKTVTVDTYGAMISVDRKTMRNDDLGMVVSKARGLGTLGAQRVEESVFVLLLSNPSSFFSVGNKNLISGGSSALGVPGLEAARQSFRGHVVNGHPIGVSPRILLVGTTLETTANQLWAEEKIAATRGDSAFENNPHKGLYRPYVTPYLNNTDITDQDGNAITGQSSTQWYLLADPNAPQGSAITISFLDGRETPYFDEAETQFNIPGGIQMRSYFDWGVAMHIEQLALRSAGA